MLMNLRVPSSTTASAGFTLIELILVMAILTMAVSVTAPTLSQFFRSRTLDAEARRLVALARAGQTRAISEGVPVDLWIDTNQKTMGLETEPSYETSDAKAVNLSMDTGLQIEVVARGASATVTANSATRGIQTSTISVPKVALVRANLPTIRFLPDGSLGENSPQMVHLMGHDGASLWVAQTRDRLSYEIRTTDQ